MPEKKCNMTRKRYPILDELRGATLISMIGFHAVWDLVYIFRVKWEWFYGPVAYLWQQSICWTFILLSGFCWSMGRKKLRRGILVLMGGVIISFVTELAMPGQRVRFGILTLLGTCMLIMIPLRKLLMKIPTIVGFGGSIGCFLLCRNINDGYLGFENVNLIALPEELYQLGDAATLFGFTDTRFYSSDYFSLLPWMFLFVTGYFGYRLAEEKKILEKMSDWKLLPKAFGWIGRQSLIIYMLHQPIIYGGLSVIFMIMGSGGKLLR